MGGYRPPPSESPDPFLPPDSAFSPFSLSRVSHSRSTSFFSSLCVPRIARRHCGSGGAGNVSFVRGPVSTGSSNHLFPSSRLYTTICTPHPASSVRVFPGNPFSQHLPSSRAVLFSRLSTLPFPPCHPRSCYVFFRCIVRPAGTRNNPSRFLAASRVHE